MNTNILVIDKNRKKNMHQVEIDLSYKKLSLNKNQSICLLQNHEPKEVTSNFVSLLRANYFIQIPP